MSHDINALWQELLEKDDRTSPAEYPDMALITFDEFRAALLSADRAATERAAKIAEDFGWVLPLYDPSKVTGEDVNRLTDDAACAVQEQIATAIRAQST